MGGSDARMTGSDQQGAAPDVRVFPHNRGTLTWFGFVMALGVVFTLTASTFVYQRLEAAWHAGVRDPLVDAIWLAAIGSLVVVMGLVVREFVRYLRKVVAFEPRGVRIGRVLLPWDELAVALEAREFKAGAWFYHLELRTYDGKREWVTSELVQDYFEFRDELLARKPELELVLLPD